MCCFFIRVLIIIGFIHFSFANVQSQTNLGTVSGKAALFNNELLLIPGLDIVVKNNEREWKTTTDGVGQFSFRLPAGIYEITTSTEMSGYFPVHRARIMIEENKSINLTLFPPVITPPPNYDHFPFRENHLQLNLVIQFYEKNVRKNFIKYKNAILTYNGTTICAAKINFNYDDYKFEAKGVYFFEQNGEHSQIKSLKGNFENQNLTLNSKY